MDGRVHIQIDWMADFSRNIDPFFGIFVAMVFVLESN